MIMAAPYAIGDLQGCAGALTGLLEQLGDEAPLRFVGDLINRGPDSLATLRRVIAMGPRARTVLGNHDLHFLAVAAGLRPSSRGDTLDDLLGAPDLPDLVDWLRRQPLAIREHGFLIVHAGVLPQWDADTVLSLAAEVEAELRGPHYRAFLAQMYGNHPAVWRDGLKGMDRLRVVVNALTRLRFCTADGEMDLQTKEGIGAAPPGFLPWFEVPHRRTVDHTVVFGHWSTLGLLQRDALIGLDTGCVWGGRLSAVRLDADPARRRLVQVDCPQAAKPGPRT